VCLGAIAEGSSRASDAGTVGYFVNPVAVPLTEIRDRGSADLLDHAASQVLAALKHARTPFDELVRSLRPARTRHPWFQTIVALQYEPPSGEMAPGTVIRPVRVPPPRTATELTVHAVPVAGGGWNLHVAWRTDGCSPAMGTAIADGVVAELDRVAGS
jgi:non-ribosomal peptide synthetase component F